MQIEPLSILLFMFETVVIASTKKTEDNEWNGLLLRSVVIVMAVNFIVANVLAPEMPGRPEDPFFSFLAPAEVKLFSGYYNLFQVIGMFVGEVVMRGFLMIVLLRGGVGDFTNSFIISLAKNVIITMAGPII